MAKAASRSVAALASITTIRQAYFNNIIRLEAVKSAACTL